MTEQKIIDLLGKRGITLLLYGAAGSGKTAALRNMDFKRGRIISTEPSGLRTLLSFGLRAADVIVPKTPEEMMDAVIACEGEQLQFICLDTISSYYEILFQSYLLKNNISPEKITFTVWNSCKAGFEQFFARCLDVAETGTDVIFLCHESREKDKDGSEEKVATIPDLPGRLPDRIARRLDLVLRSIRTPLGLDARYQIILPIDGYGKATVPIMDRAVDNDIAAIFAAFRAKMLTYTGSGAPTQPVPTAPVPAALPPRRRVLPVAPSAPSTVAAAPASPQIAPVAASAPVPASQAQEGLTPARKRGRPRKQPPADITRPDWVTAAQPGEPIASPLPGGPPVAPAPPAPTRMIAGMEITVAPAPAPQEEAPDEQMVTINGGLAEADPEADLEPLAPAPLAPPPPPPAPAAPQAKAPPASDFGRIRLLMTTATEVGQGLSYLKDYATKQYGVRRLDELSSDQIHSIFLHLESLREPWTEEQDKGEGA